MLLTERIRSLLSFARDQPQARSLGSGKLGLKMAYLFGPVLSRRLGLSLGVDLLRHKTCNLDCVYCELGRTRCLTAERERFVPRERVLSEIKQRSLDSFDFLTFAGSGEPTLSKDLGEIIEKARELVGAPLAVITNSTLFSSPSVRREVSLADVVLPSLDAATQSTFRAINRPAAGLRIEGVIEGLQRFRGEYGGEIWLEVMLAKHVNDQEAELIAQAAESISPDRIQLNTVVRPPAEPVEPLGEEEMEKILEAFPGAELIPDWDWRVPERLSSSIQDLLSRRPCTLEEMRSALDLESEAAIKYLKILERDGLVKRIVDQGRLRFCSMRVC
jgi:wyosine [tRNA(Phe)-imidazoG37] synthetase (radical SAM superfamily)